jgi:hypothetical protein
MATKQTSVGAMLREKYDAMTPENQEQLGDSLRKAIYHLAACWDACFDAEVLCGQEFDVESEHISGLTGDIGEPSEAHALSIGDILDRMEVE